MRILEIFSWFLIENGKMNITLNNLEANP